ncbi:hypothetical protein G5I_05241 [Acromyrmex echinatior]|uniref:Uncharacterized protein n=1 Tax=Acromyrmex echinatior TaxID=103372 RepID=F4WHS1_ACREC|nr:hypothetical protein G5I_05241 [Acromyrmex echinatior]
MISTDRDLTITRSPHSLSSGFFSYETDTKAQSELLCSGIKSEGIRSFCVAPSNFMSLIEAVTRIAFADGRDLKPARTPCSCRSKTHGCSLSVSNREICRPCKRKPINLRMMAAAELSSFVCSTCELVHRKPNQPCFAFRFSLIGLGIGAASIAVKLHVIPVPVAMTPSHGFLEDAVHGCNTATKEIGIQGLRVLAVLFHACIEIGSQSIQIAQFEDLWNDIHVLQIASDLPGVCTTLENEDEITRRRRQRLSQELVATATTSVRYRLTMPTTDITLKPWVPQACLFPSSYVIPEQCVPSGALRKRTIPTCPVVRRPVRAGFLVYVLFTGLLLVADLCTYMNATEIHCVAASSKLSRIDR